MRASLIGILCALATVARAASPEVRPVPKKGIALAEPERRALEGELSSLAEEMKRLRQRPEVAAGVPDVEIFYRAVDSAVRNGELFAEEEITKAHELLAVARERARALASGKTPWLERPGYVALGYVSRLDGSVQPYGLHLPDGFVARAPHRWRLDAWFHGRDETLSEVNFVSGVAKAEDVEFAPLDALLLQPYGRYCNGSVLAGEVDFWEALADVKRRFAVDDDRIVIRGFSLGGHSAWHLGAHFASDWAAVAPGAGFAESREFLTFWEKDKLEPTWWEEKLWQLYDAPAYAENFRNVGVVAYSGEKDRQKQAADLMAKTLAAVGVHLVHVIGPGTAHAYHPAAKVTIDRLVDALAQRGRDPVPRRLSLQTPTLKYNRQAWLTVDGLGEHWSPAKVEGELRGDHQVVLTTRNVTALTVAMPPGRAPFFPGTPIALSIDGQRLTGPPIESDRSFVAHFHRAGRLWAAGESADPGLRKRHDLQGPIDDAFMDSFLMVAPSGKPLSPAVGAWAMDEMNHAIRAWRREFRAEPRVRQDTAVSADDIARHNLVLWGDPQSNEVYGRLADKLPLRWTKDAVVVGKQSFPAVAHALIAVYPNPLNPQRYVVINSGFTFREYDDLNNARQTPKLPDWAVVDTRTKPDARWPGAIVAADFFDERWGLKPPHEPVAKRGNMSNTTSNKISDKISPLAP